MIHTKPIDQITWEDVVAFCEQRIREGQFLDYKEAFPTSLEKTIAAMANTFGGVIIIGAAEDDDNRPLLPLKGVPTERGLSERVVNIVLTHISPPVFPEIAVCNHATESTSVLVLRVPQSPHAPHAISGNTSVYVRTGDVNTPERLVTLDQLDWLTARREKSVKLRHTLINQAHDRYDAFEYRISDMLLSKDIESHTPDKGILTLAISPTYPQTPFRSPPELMDIRKEILVTDVFRTGDFFPQRDTLSGSGSATLLQDAVAFVSYVDNAARVFYAEVNSLGHYFYRQQLRREEVEHMDSPNQLLSASETFARVDEFMLSSARLYSHLGYWGYITLEASLSEIKDIGFVLDWSRTSFPADRPHGFSPDPEVSYAATIPASSFASSRDDLLLSIARKFSWAFGIQLEKPHLQNYFKSIGRPTIPRAA